MLISSLSKGQLVINEFSASNGTQILDHDFKTSLRINQIFFNPDNLILPELISVYPNPSKGLINISNSNGGLGIIEIYN